MYDHASSRATAVTELADGLKRMRDFRLLSSAQSVTVFGDQFIVLALPLLAVTALGATPAEAALLPFALFAPFLVVGLPSGAIVDRVRRRSITGRMPSPMNRSDWTDSAHIWRAPPVRGLWIRRLTTGQRTRVAAVLPL